MILECKFKSLKEACSWPRGHQNRPWAVGETTSPCMEWKCELRILLRDKERGNSKGQCNHIWVVSAEREREGKKRPEYFHWGQVTPKRSLTYKTRLRTHTDTKNEHLSTTQVHNTQSLEVLTTAGMQRVSEQRFKSEKHSVANRVDSCPTLFKMS